MAAGTKYLYSRKIIRTLASGDTLSIPVYTFQGSKKDAPSAYFQSAVHGSEVQGSLAIAQLIDYFSQNPPLGTVRLVPNANPVGLNEKRGEYTDGRFDPSTGDNWNRMYYLAGKNFPLKKEPQQKTWERFREYLKNEISQEAKKPHSYAASLALTLQELSIDFDHCLDLHCANRSVRHVYVPSYAAKDATYMGIPFHIIMENKFGGAMDEVFFHPWWLVQEKIGGEIPVQSFTLELGDHENISSAEAKHDIDGILNYLKHRGVIKGTAKPHKPTSCKQDDYLLVPAPTGGLVEFHAPLGKLVNKGELLAKIYQFEKSVEAKEILSPVTAIPILYHSSSIVHEGAELLKLFAKPY